MHVSTWLRCTYVRRMWLSAQMWRMWFYAVRLVNRHRRYWATGRQIENNRLDFTQAQRLLGYRGRIHMCNRQAGLTGSLTSDVWKVNVDEPFWHSGRYSKYRNLNVRAMTCLALCTVAGRDVVVVIIYHNHHHHHHYHRHHRYHHDYHHFFHLQWRDSPIGPWPLQHFKFIYPCLLLVSTILLYSAAARSPF
jgi:hypothetical protein